MRSYEVEFPIEQLAFCRELYKITENQFMEEVIWL